MPDLSFQVEEVEPQRFAAVPTLRFRLRVAEAAPEGDGATPIHAVALRCQIRVEPARRRYDDRDRQRLRAVFGAPEQWGQTLRPMPWTQVSAIVPPFTGAGGVDLPVACSSDFCLAATRYFDALEGGDLPLCFLFSGTIFYEGPEGALQVAPISWEKEAAFRLPAATWRGLMDLYYPDSTWLCLRKDTVDRLDQYRSREGLPTCEHALERLLASSEETVAP